MKHSNPPRYAVIDLGTNTFHLLVVDFLDNGEIYEVYRERRFVYLAENGISTLGKAPYQRGLETMIAFKNKLEEFGVTELEAKGTAGLRTASNGVRFLDEVKKYTGIEVALITGEEEARLIYKGVRQAFPMPDSTSLIMDIGGGSVEFIIANNSELFWAASFPVGVALLYKKFHRTDPISSEDIAIMQSYLKETLAPLYEALKSYPVTMLIGASGTFDVLENILTLEFQHPHAAEVNLDDLLPLYDRVVRANKEKRLAMDDIPDSRASLIVVALVLAEFVIRTCNIRNLVVSNYAMKEGILSKWITS